MAKPNIETEPLEWLRKWRSLLSINAIEKEIRIPSSVLARALDGTRPLPEKYQSAVMKLVERMRK